MWFAGMTLARVHVPLASGVARVSLASLPSAVQGDLFIELASVRWPFVQGRAGPFHSGAGVAAPAPSLAGATSQGGALTAAAALVAGAALVLLLPFAFLRLRLKAYGKMGGAVVFQWRAGFGGPGAARAQQADEEMAPMACTGRAGHGEAPPTAVALGRASATCARPAGL
ncbi:unnamed protein product [Prorocentrum cordatum]|uniref:Uncharacterized protein n=1 Tax=Prorocentrum cordatum TaxID=2364126 RepID=A0ABN9U283_9DINO|nr:unnamed protein product [Polarella glacialis]